MKILTNYLIREITGFCCGVYDVVAVLYYYEA